MSPRTIILRPEAEADLAEVRSWYEQQRQGLGAELLLCIDALFERIDRTPEIYPVMYRDVRRAFTRRFPYVVYYRIGAANIVVLGIFHSRRGPRVWQARLKGSKRS